MAKSGVDNGPAMQRCGAMRAITHGGGSINWYNYSKKTT